MVWYELLQHFTMLSSSAFEFISNGNIVWIIYEMIIDMQKKNFKIL